MSNSEALASPYLERSSKVTDLEGLAESERQRRFYETILLSTQDLVYVFDLQHRFTYANNALLKTWGRSWDDAIGKTCSELGYEPWHAEMHDREIEEVIATKKPIRGVVSFTGVFGPRNYDYIFTPVFDSDGNVEAVAGTTRDVTDQVAAENALRESELRYRSLFETMEEGFCVLELIYDPDSHPTDYRFLQANPAFEKVSGLHDAVGRTISEIMPDVHPMWIHTFASVAKTAKPKHIVERANSSGRWFDVYAFAVGELPSRKVAALFSDITERKRRETNLVLISEIDRELGRNVPASEVMHVVGQKIGEHLSISGCNFCQVNEAANTLTTDFGWSNDSVPNLLRRYELSQYFTESFIQAGRAGEPVIIRDTQNDSRVDAKAYAALNIRSFIMVPFHRDGRWTDLFGAVDSRPREWREDELELVADLGSRIFPRLERARAEQALRDAEAQYRQIAEGLPQMVWSAGPNGKRDYFNSRWTGFTGVGIDEEEDPWTAAMHPDDAERAQDAWKRAVESGNSFQSEYRLRDRDGRFRWFLGLAIALRNEKGQVIRWFGTCTDFNEQKVAQDMLQISNDFAMALAADLDMERIIQSLTDACTSAISAEFGAFLSKASGEVEKQFSLAALSKNSERALKIEFPARGAGALSSLFRSNGVFRTDNIEADHACEALHAWAKEKLVWLRSCLSVPVVSRSGEVLGGLVLGHSKQSAFSVVQEQIVSSLAAQAALAMDNASLYERVRGMNEDLELKVQARTSELLAAIEQLQGFTYHVSHDLRAPLRAIASTSRIIKEDFGAEWPEEVHRLLDRQVGAASRLGTLVDDLLKLSRLSRQEMIRQKVDMTALAYDVFSEAQSIHPYSEVTIEVEDGLEVEADPRLLRLALLNVVENAVKYSPVGGTVHVGRREDGTFYVSDEGIGMDSQYLSKIFEPFQRLHRDDEFSGNGIGLANVRQVIDRHGGSLWAESELGRGSVFFFTLR